MWHSNIGAKDSLLAGYLSFIVTNSRTGPLYSGAWTCIKSSVLNLIQDSGSDYRVNSDSRVVLPVGRDLLRTKRSGRIWLHRRSSRSRYLRLRRSWAPRRQRSDRSRGTCTVRPGGGSLRRARNGRPPRSRCGCGAHCSLGRCTADSGGIKQQPSKGVGGWCGMGLEVVRQKGSWYACVDPSD